MLCQGCKKETNKTWCKSCAGKIGALASHRKEYPFTEGQILGIRDRFVKEVFRFIFNNIKNPDKMTTTQIKDICAYYQADLSKVRTQLQEWVLKK